uniref:Putative secreted protein ovary overexpressed n=1 Tax=Rhipicephalus microplus TaxID=6941 RepID=A0A6M2DBI4_RHIMP
MLVYIVVLQLDALSVFCARCTASCGLLRHQRQKRVLRHWPSHKPCSGCADCSGWSCSKYWGKASTRFPRDCSW